MATTSSTTPPKEMNDEKMEMIISTLPQSKGWIPQPLYNYSNFWLYKPELERVIASNENFFHQPNTIVLSTFPKCGTTWFSALLFTIINRSLYDDFTKNPLLKSNPLDCVRSIEPNSNKTPSNSLVKTHFPYSLLPESIKELGCPIIYVSRDPMDAFISLWHFTNKLMPKESPPISIDDAFEMFCQGVAPFGPFWDHVLEYWKASLDKPNKVMFVRYEDMKCDPVNVLKKMATFIGYDFSPEEEQNGVMERIVEFCSFDKLSNLEVNKSLGRKTVFKEDVPIRNNVYFRKGDIGDHKNYLTDEMVARLKKIIDEKLRDYGLDGYIYA